jgi:hypothetical protein
VSRPPEGSLTRGAHAQGYFALVTLRSIRCLLATIATVAALTAGSVGAASAASVHAAGAFKPHGIYDCSVLQAITGIRVYVTTIAFKSGRTYSNGLRGTGTSLAGVSTGRYKLAGSKIIPLSGRLKKLHESLLIQQADLAVLDSSGHFTSLGCFLRGNGHPTPDPGTTQGAGTFPIGDYNCYHVNQQPNGSFDSQFATRLSFWSDGTYLSQGSIRGPAWNQSGDTINFTAGSLASTFTHDVGTWVPGGVAMPHASGSFTGSQYTFVLRSTKPNEVSPPMTEFTGPVPESFDYCKHA